MRGLVDIIEDQSVEINNLKAENESLKKELSNSIKESEKKLNKKDISNKETLVMLFEDVELLKLRVAALENAVGIKPMASKKKNDFEDEDLEGLM